MHAVLRGREGAGPPLVYLPGIDGTGDYLLGTGPRLAGRFALVRLAYRFEPGEPDSYPALAASCAERMAEAVGGPACVLAESFGVALALQLALDHPEAVRALCLVNGFARFDRPFHLVLSRALAPLVRPWMFAVGRRLAARTTLFWPRRDPEALRAFVATPPSLFDAGYRRRLSMIRTVDLLPRLGELRVPVAIYAADRDRVVHSVAAGEAMRERLPDATLEVLPRAGHLVLPLGAEPWVERVEALCARA